ncbi:FtsK/SpoIIIE domain-containing protein [Leifsonia sp. Root112D2]|uniref:FtsK/SpoIIIE domain-containing protein n=1 Tax=Leifsonia sp. Root112D2 TaxID=1736426 RepID=UPI0006FA5D65|nr:FtsK/SpoIIIE domain-containing protein [Leifsonia sp. Root112D2]KQV07158.1 phosphopeptide-binding protein [Leifsonia sp. Root112D2]
MRLKLTLSRPSGQADDIVVTTDAAASIADIATSIKRLDPTGDAAPAYVDDRGLTLAATLPGQPEALILPPDAPVGEAWIGSGATVALADAGVYYSPNATGKAPTAATLKVLTGPDAGAEFALAPGTTVLGREASCDIVLQDKLVSKRHVRFEVSNVVEVVDLGSANGVVVDGGIVTRLRIEKSETLLIGDSQVLVTVVSTVAQTGAAPKAGPIFFNRSPKVEQRYAGKEYPGPDVPAEKEEPPFPLLAMITPFLMGGAMFFIMGNPSTLLFCLMSPLMMIGNFATQKKREKRRLKKAIVKFDSRLEVLTAQLAEERETEYRLRLGESPSTKDAYDHAIRRGPLLWTRRPEHWSFLNVRLGIGTMKSRNTVQSGGSGDMLPEYQERLDAVIDEHKYIAGVPLIDNLFESGALGVAGSPAQAMGSINSILVQLTALHSPAELVVASLVTPRWSRELEWLKWIPHTSSPHSPIEGSHLADSATSGSTVLSAIEGVIEQRFATAQATAQRRGAMVQDDAAIERGSEVGAAKTVQGTPSPIPAIVVLISDDVAVDRARLVQLAEMAADAGVYPIWIAPDVAALPAVCRTYLELGSESEGGEPGTATVGFVRLGETITDVVTEQVDSEVALDFAKRMAPVIDAGALVADSSDLPRSVSMIALLGHEMIEASDAVIDRWRQNASIHDRSGGPLKPRRAGKLRAIIGSSGVDAMHLDLRTQGPHALVGGTTGAGKSEFLQAWVLGMAAEYSSDRVTFLFVDYKGGSAFADCVTLPHCVGLVTDLSPHLVRRALTSLRAELHYREHLLNRKKAKDLLELEKRGDPESPPALVLVIDEFAALAGEVPEFVDGVVDIAQRGRSLGIHLIMATQRPAGVIKDNLRANTNMRIALRMADESDSQDVVGIKDAAHFDPGIPGRGVAKTGPGRLVQFQSGYAGGWTSREPERADIEVAELRFGGENRWEEPGRPDVEEIKDLGPTDQQKLVASIIGAQKLASIPAPRRPWLDELASAYDLGLLRQRTDSELLLGVSDIAERQQQVPVYFQPDVDGNISIFGTGGSGKSAVLRTLASAAAITPRGGPVQVYGLDFGSGSLRMLEQLPHVGSIINGDDAERIIRLFRMLQGVLDDRKPRYAEANASSISEYRTLAGKPAEPRILLLIDGFPNFRNDFEIPAGRSIWYDVFKDILSDGRQLGMHIALTADRAGAVPASISSTIQRKVVLRLADDGYGMLDVPGDILSTKSPAGRAIVDGAETQIAILGGSSSVSDQSTATRKLAEAMRRANVPEAPAIGSLPKEYAATNLPDSVKEFPVLGISDLDLGPFGFDPTGTMLLAGPPASGRTTALRAIAESMRRFDPEVRMYYFGNARSPLTKLVDWTEAAVTVEAVAALAKDLAAAVSDQDTEGRIAVFIEAIGDFLQTPADSAIVELTKATRRSDHFLIAENETSAWGSSWPLLGEVKNGRRGLLLQPDSIEGDILLKTPLPRLNRSEFPPGRGVYIAKGQFARVQLPLPDGA